MNWLTRAFPVRASRRAAALTAGCTAALAATLCMPAHATIETRSVADFDEIVFSVAGEVSVEQGSRESLSLDAEPAVLRKITTEIRDRRLIIGVSPSSRIETNQPIRMKIGVRQLRAFESRTSGAISIGPLRSDTLALVLAGGGSIRVDRLDNAANLKVQITGAGDISVGGGKVTAQQLAITGTGTYSAPKLASERAEVAIDGSGEVQLAASATLAVRVDGIGNVRYHGDPAVTRSIRGIGSINKD
ncbi:head GIN domain-containing protein [Variovorax sp. J22R133]|uniref:head GIN domain-containing protein n=1 Tax=Variovorax brevis TaxID=3053503 RepID=UPI002577B02E|nr:head GIN domain-containing protein [Variovorax sp. J22R133]MDM0115685.1 head GIN domain-containing protein [Variovorax sp. J22R133]